METRDQKENWKRILNEASVEPSPAVWEGVEFQLDKSEVKTLRRSVLFYKWLTAACITMAVLATGTTYFTNDRNAALVNQNQLMALQNSRPEQEVQQDDYTGSAEMGKSESKTEAASSEINKHIVTTYSNANTSSQTVIQPEAQQQYPRRRSLSTYGTQQHTSVFAESSSPFNNSTSSTWLSSSSFSATKHQQQTPALKEEGEVESPLLKEKENAQAYSLLADLQKEAEEKPSVRQEEKFWTAVGFSAGTFNNTTPNSASTSGSALQSFSAGQTAASESNSPGYTYAINLSVGTKVSKRWLVHGGMSYISQQTDYTATTVVTNQSDAIPLKAASINQFEKKIGSGNAESLILASTPYEVNNNIQMISFPLQAGYMLVDRKLALQVNSGISTDLFMQNTITPEADNLEKTTQGRGDDSPYRPINFSGLIGTEVSYRFSESYRISISPGLRYPFNSIYKSDLGIKSSPLTFDVALRFRYILK